MSIKSALISYHEQLYKEYIAEHITNVQRAWALMKNNKEVMNYIESNLTNMSLDGTISVIDELVLHHDKSKYGKEEFEPYRKHFYPVDDKEKDESEKEFEEAWKHHYTNNLHHWDWWHLSGNADSMPLIYVIEMICDWEAMSFKYNNISKKWYEENKSEIFLGAKQKVFVEDLLDILAN